MEKPLEIKDKPDWRAAAQTLVNSCATLKSSDERVRLLEQLCLNLGNDLYPAFLHILCHIEQHGSRAAQALITDALVNALISGRLPSGELSAWGATNLESNNQFAHSRSLGPIEYLCAWYSQPSGQHPLPANDFQQVMILLIRLISTNTTAKELYCEKLTSDIENPIGGTLSSQTKNAILELINAWKQDKDVLDIVDTFINALQGDATERLANFSFDLKRP